MTIVCMFAVFLTLKRFLRPACLPAALLVLTIAAASAPAAEAADVQEPEAGPVRLALSSFALPQMRDPIEKSTVAAVEKFFGKTGVTVRSYSVPALEEAVRRGEVDLIVSSAGAARRFAPYGAKSLLTSVAPGLEDPNHNEGSAIVVRKDSPYRTLSDLKGKRIAANFAEGFSGYQIALGEIARLGEDPEHFFSDAVFFGRSDAMPEVADAVAKHRVDAGILRLCALEAMTSTYPTQTSELRVLPPPEDAVGNVVCRHSTHLYPAQTLSIMPSVPPAVAKHLILTLLSLPPAEDGRSWAVATDFQAVDELLKTLKIGPYSYLRQWTLQGFFLAYWPAFAFLAAAVFGLFLHSIRTDKLVARREAQLSEAYAKQSEQTERINQLQRAGAVGQLSSLIAHEVHQPLAAIRFYAEALARQTSNGGTDKATVELVCGNIAEQAQRASAIVDRVRSYARQHRPQREQFSPQSFIDRLEGTYPQLFEQTLVRTTGDLEQDRISGCRLDLELAVVNLLRNAIEASRTNPRLIAPGINSRRSTHRTCPLAELTVRVDASTASLRMEVLDIGPRISDEKLAALSAPTTSEKPEGLGLGLAIVRNIVEQHGGTLCFSRRLSDSQADGLRAEITLPLSNIENNNEAPHAAHSNC